MLASKAILYCATLAIALSLAFLELKLKRELSEEALQSNTNSGDFGVVGELRKSMMRERFLTTLPSRKLGELRIVIGLKFLFVSALIVEVVVLQK